MNQPYSDINGETEQAALRFAEHSLLFPVPLLTFTNAGKWHARVFIEATKWWDYKLVGKAKMADNLIFTNAEDRRVFRRWWGRYSTWFGRPPHRAFLPEPPSGKLPGRGVVVPFADPLFDKSYEVTVGRAGCTSSLHELADLSIVHAGTIAREWAWMSTHCKKPVYRLNGAWLFTSAADAVLHKLYQDNRETPRMAA